MIYLVVSAKDNRAVPLVLVNAKHLDNTIVKEIVLGQ